MRDLRITSLPPHLLLEVTARCNYHCPFCYCVWNEIPSLGGEDLDTSAWEEILRECARRCVRELVFTGGEATLRADIWHLLEVARELLPQGTVSLFTNGSTMTEERLFWCKERKVYLSTSLQGLRTYGKHTGTRRSCKRTLSLLARASELEWPMDVSISVSRINSEEAVDLFTAATLSHARSIQMGAVMVEGRCRKRLDLPLTPAEWETLKAQIRALPNGQSVGFADEMLCACRKQPLDLLTAYGETSTGNCTAGKEFGVIGPTGLFRKCLHTVEAFAWR